MKLTRKYALFAGILSLIPQMALSSTLYVTDILYVPIRRGPSPAHKILKTLKSGARVTVVDDSVTDGFIEVKTSGGMEGFIPKRYLVDTPIAAIQLASAQAKAQKAGEGAASTVAKLDKFKERFQNQKKELAKVSKERDRLARQLASVKSISGQSLEIAAERDLLLKQSATLNKENEGLVRQNNVLMENSRNEGIKLGIAAVALGALIGLALPYLKPRKGRRGLGAVRIR